MRTKKMISNFAEEMTSVKTESFFEKLKNWRILMKVMNALKWQRSL